MTNDEIASENQRTGLFVLGNLVQSQAALLVKQALADERQALVAEIYSKFIDRTTGDPTAIDIIEIIRKRNEA